MRCRRRVHDAKRGNDEYEDAQVQPKWRTHAEPPHRACEFK